MGKIRVGIIGTGSISEMHFEAYKNHKDVEIAAICDLNEDRVIEQAKKHHVDKYFTDYNDLLKLEDIEAVSICTWNNSHAEIAIAAFKAGKHVLVEKPLCRTLEEAKSMEKEIINNRNQVFQVGFVRRHGTSVKVLKKFIDAGSLGEIYYAKASYLRALGNPGGWFADKERSGGGPLIDLGVHVIDLSWYLMGKPKVKSVSGNTYQRLGNRSNIENKSFYKAADYHADQNSVEDMVSAMIRFDNGASIMVDASFSLHAKRDSGELKVFGDKGGAEIDPSLHLTTEENDTILNITPNIDQMSFIMQDGFQNEINHFISCIKGEEETVAPFTDGVEIMKILDAIYRSSQTGKEVYFD